MRIVTFLFLTSSSSRGHRLRRQGLESPGGEAISKGAVHRGLRSTAPGERPHPQNLELSLEARDRVLEEVGVSEEDLLTFVDIWGNDGDLMVEIWGTIDSLMTQDRMLGRGRHRPTKDTIRKRAPSTSMGWVNHDRPTSVLGRALGRRRSAIAGS